jgi:zinc transporter ZupT
MGIEASTIIVGSVPAMCMLVMTIVGLGIRVPDDIAGALQHFAAGLLLSAVGSELLPTLLNATGFRENLYATIGFFAGMAVLIVLGALLPEAHGHDDDDHDDNDNDDGGHRDSSAISASINRSLRGKSIAGDGRAMSLRQSAKKINATFCDSCDTLAEAGHDHESKPLLVADTHGSDVVKALEVVEKALPLSFIAAIVVDAFMDGFLIGIAGAAGPSATIIMAGSLSVEMSFVGLTLATACHGMPYSKSIPAAIAGPLFLIIGALVGDTIADFVGGEPALLAAAMGFGTSALLFMVAEELLLEAHEDGGEHVWWVDVQLYTGFYWGFMSTKFIPE